MRLFFSCLIALWLIFGFFFSVVWGVSLTISDDLFVGGVKGDEYTEIDFPYGGTNNNGLIWYTDLGNDRENVSVGGDSLFCQRHIQGLYYANTRGLRLRPLDAGSLSQLQTVDGSYNSLSLSGGLYTQCDGVDSDAVYGAIVYTYSGSKTAIMAGLAYDFPNDVPNFRFDESLYYYPGWGFNGHLYDTVQGIGKMNTPKPVSGGSSQPVSSVPGAAQGVTSPVTSTGSGLSSMHPCLSGDVLYDKELSDAYIYSYDSGFVEECPAADADLLQPLLRKDLTKIMSIFAIKELDRIPLRGKEGCNQYADWGHLDDRTQAYIQLGCELQIMGMAPDGVTPRIDFMPDKVVSRAEFGTVLSRMLFDRSFDGNNENRYIDHLNNLKRLGIMTQIDSPLTREEVRGYVMIMLHRLHQKSVY